MVPWKHYKVDLEVFNHNSKVLDNSKANKNCWLTKVTFLKLKDCTS